MNTETKHDPHSVITLIKEIRVDLHVVLQEFRFTLHTTGLAAYTHLLSGRMLLGKAIEVLEIVDHPYKATTYQRAIGNTKEISKATDLSDEKIKFKINVTAEDCDRCRIVLKGILARMNELFEKYTLHFSHSHWGIRFVERAIEEVTLARCHVGNMLDQLSRNDDTPDSENLSIQSVYDKRDLNESTNNDTFEH